MTGESVAKVLGALPPLIWIGVIVYFLYLTRASLPSVLQRLTGVEAFGLKLALSGGQAMSAAIDLAAKNPAWNVEISQADRDKALERAKRERALLDGAEILWVDDHPTNNRNEARMLRSFGALVTFASTTSDAIRAVKESVGPEQAFHLILSDMARDFPTADPQAGVQMLADLQAANIHLKVIFYVGRLTPGAPPPSGAFGITNRPDVLLHLILDALARVRSVK